jgi:predicted nucleotidyltransferase
MRLTDQQIETIRNIGQDVFGEGVRIFLFGSRVNDEKRGGDIDLFIESENSESMNIKNKIMYLAKLKLALGDQKIDLVFGKNLGDRQIFRNTINSDRIQLC